MGTAERTGRRGQRVARIHVGQLCDGQRVEQLDVAQTTAAAFEVRLGAVRDLSAALPAGLGVLDEFVEARGDSGAPLAAGAADQQRRQLRVAGDVPGLQHRQAGRDVITGDLQGLRHGADAVVEPNVGVPQRIPQQLGDLRHDVVGHVVVQQHEIEVRVRNQLAAAQPAGGHDGEPASGGDPDLGGLGGQPELVQIEQRVAQGGRIELALAALEQLRRCRREIFGGLRRTRRRGLPSGGAGGGIALLLCHLSPPAAVAD